VSGAEQIDEAVAVLRRGGLVAFPTETVYGLGCDAENADALRRLYAVKGRPADHPVIVHLGRDAELDGWASAVTPEARMLADRCWPGPLTIVVARGPRALDEVTGGRETVGLRVPGQPVALALLDAFGGGLAAPSANRFGRVSPTTAADVRGDLNGDVDVVLDGGPCTVGVESTIVDCSGPDPGILRLGALPREQLEDTLGRKVPLRAEGEVAAPGTLPAHYSPRARVLLVESSAVADRATSLLTAQQRVGLLALAPPKPVPSGLVVLDPPADIDDYARVLYARLRETDRRHLDVLLAVPPPEVGLGAAVADRLRRASA
jgi:L-threonylcarbamoyladenylate synthase